MVMIFKEYILLEPIEVGRDELATPVYKWAETGKIRGMMDYQSGDNRDHVHSTYYPDATHVFITDGYPSFDVTVFNKLRATNGDEFTIHYVDNVGEIDDHLEIYCEKKGGNNDVYI